MKIILTLLASCALFSTVASAHPECESGPRVVGHTRCGDPIFAYYEVVGHSRCGDPIREWVTHYPREREETVVVRREPHEHYRYWEHESARGHDRDDHHRHGRD